MRLTLILLLFAFTSSAQQNFTGYKKKFLDSNLCPTDSVKACYFGYAYLNEGKSLFEFKCTRRQKNLIVSIESSSELLTAVNGLVSFTDEAGTVIEEHIYENGYPKYLKTYNYGADKSYYWVDMYYFDSLYHDTPGTYFFETKNSKGELVSQGYFRKGAVGWQVYELENWKDVHLVEGDDSYDIIKEKDGEYKWPYYGENIPPYLGLIAGYEGVAWGSLVGGLAFNISDSYVPRKTGAMLGGAVMFRYNIPVSIDTTGTAASPEDYWDPYWGLRAEIGNYSTFTYALGYDFFAGGGEMTHGVTPMFGTSFYNVQVMLSYTFYSRDKNEIGRLRGGRINLRYVLPLPRKNYAPKE